MPVSLEIRDLHKSFGATKALDGISLRVEPGEIFFLLGPSGCGKTTLLRHVAGFLQPDRGAVLVDGGDVTALPPHRRDTAMVFQGYALWPHLTVAENVAFGLEMRGVPAAERRARVVEALSRVKMDALAARKPAELSGGQQQRVALARALVVRPRCLLLDEPLSNLDAQLRLEMRGEIRRLCKESGLTALYVTHDQKEALSIADRLAVLRAGRLEQCGTPLELYRHPVNRFTAAFMGETNFLPPNFFGAALAAPAGTQAFSIRPEAIRFGARPAEGTLRLKGTLHGTIYLGETAQHLLDVAGADGAPTTLKILESNPETIARDDRHENVEAWVRVCDVIPLAG